MALSPSSRSLMLSARSWCAYESFLAILRVDTGRRDPMCDGGSVARLCRPCGGLSGTTGDRTQTRRMPAHFLAETFPGLWSVFPRGWRLMRGTFLRCCAALGRPQCAGLVADVPRNDGPKKRLSEDSLQTAKCHEAERIAHCTGRENSGQTESDSSTHRVGTMQKQGRCVMLNKQTVHDAQCPGNVSCDVARFEPKKSWPAMYSVIYGTLIYAEKYGQRLAKFEEELQFHHATPADR